VRHRGDGLSNETLVSGQLCSIWLFPPIGKTRYRIILRNWKPAS
jgi:hypothetical protein